MRLSFGAAAAVAALLLSSSARADGPVPPGPPPARQAAPDGALAALVGGAAVFLGFAVGGTIIAANSDLGTATDKSNAATQAGWFVIESGFAVAPFAAHAVVGEWGRGAVFASIPAATTLATIPVFVEKPGAVQHGSLEQQRAMWGLFCGGLAGAMVGIVDAALAPGRAVHVTPMLGQGSAGLVLGGAL